MLYFSKLKIRRNCNCNSAQTPWRVYVVVIFFIIYFQVNRSLSYLSSSDLWSRKEMYDVELCNLKSWFEPESTSNCKRVNVQTTERQSKPSHRSFPLPVNVMNLLLVKLFIIYRSIFKCLMRITTDICVLSSLLLKLVEYIILHSNVFYRLLWAVIFRRAVMQRRAKQCRNAYCLRFRKQQLTNSSSS